MGNIWQLQPHTHPWGCQGSWGPTVGTKAKQAELAGTGSTMMCISAPSALHLHPAGTFEDATWPMFRCQTPQHWQTDAVLPEH